MTANGWGGVWGLLAELSCGFLGLGGVVEHGALGSEEFLDALLGVVEHGG
jgi:hypothetical protein